MILKYKKVHGSQAEKPLEIDEDSSKYVTYIRKNIKENIINNEDGSSTTYWEYDECALTKEEYEQYKKEINEDIIAKQQEQIDILTQCIMEMGMVVYGD